MRVILEAVNLHKIYVSEGGVKVHALRGINLKVLKGEFVAIIGPSGSGKTTLLNVLGLLDKPDSGEVYIEGRPVSGLNDDELSEVRLRKIGFVFQHYNLIPILTALENVEMPLLLAGVEKKERIKRAKMLLEMVGITDVEGRKPNEMSGGQQQRVAIARALANKPSIILADEPTGNLDTKSSEDIVSLMLEINRNCGTTFIVVTHDMDVAKRAERILRIRDGKLYEVKKI